jgi:hypothetical protein
LGLALLSLSLPLPKGSLWVLLTEHLHKLNLWWCNGQPTLMVTIPLLLLRVLLLQWLVVLMLLLLPMLLVMLMLVL